MKKSKNSVVIVYSEDMKVFLEIRNMAKSFKLMTNGPKQNQDRGIMMIYPIETPNQYISFRDWMKLSFAPIRKVTDPSFFYVECEF